VRKGAKAGEAPPYAKENRGRTGKKIEDGLGLSVEQQEKREDGN